MTIRIEFGSDTNVGRVRDHNEDSLESIHFRGGDVAIVCDGMGGHAAGDVASRVACSTIAASLVDNQFDDPRELLYRALESAHQRVLTAAQASGNAGMGTTAVVALIRTGALFLGHVGDSRAYLVRSGKVSQLTRDQTKVQDLIDQGVLSEDAAKTHPDAGVLAQAIGQPRGLLPFVTPDDGGIALQPEDTLILCSDGVYDGLTEDDFRSLTVNRTPEAAAHALVAAAVERDGQDNATAVVGVVVSDASRRAVAPTVVESPPDPPDVMARHTAPNGHRPARVVSPLELWGMRALVAGLLLVGLPVAFLWGHSCAAKRGTGGAVPLPTSDIVGAGGGTRPIPADAGVLQDAHRPDAAPADAGQTP